MTALLCLLFFVSGASALVFETLWFRQAGLMFGNSVWASSLVTASFMAGLAVGNAVAARRGDALRRPVLAYAGLEAAIGLGGAGLVLLFPALTPVLAPLLSRLFGRPELLNACRLVLAFLLLLVPATAMGATLPLLTRALSAREADFGRVLGRLYGFNTLGAVAGAVAGEAFLIERLGLRGTGVAACGLNLAAAATAAFVSKRFPGEAALQAPAHAPPVTRRGRLLLLAAFLCGGLLLALEVVWFRFLLLFVNGTSLTFALMLAVVLLGIALGGLAADLWLRWRPEAHRLLPALALGAGMATVLTYAGFSDLVSEGGARYFVRHGPILHRCIRLMLPVSLLSGLLFTLVGRALQEELRGKARTAGALTLANTVGAALGALAAGFALLPRLGMEISFFLLAAGYGVVALACARRRGLARAERLGLWGAAAAFAVVLGLFPFGLMRNRYVRISTANWTRGGGELVAWREGLTETIGYVRQDQFGEPLSYRLVTNGFSMSGTNVAAERYMTLFVYWPGALRPEPRRALLISFGIGSTAKALTETASLEVIDVVDISRDILEMGRVAFTGEGAYPLDDPRVRVHVEDGRFFLLTTDRRYDLITAEPPPPKNAGIANLYSREHFRLIHDRLASGGVASYWLPAYQLELAETKAVIRAFCDAFADCSLWTGAGIEWMLAGSRGLRGPVIEEALTRQWRDPVVGARMRALGFESPELLGTTFIGDASFLRDLTAGTPALEDDHPLRLSGRIAYRADPAYATLMDTDATRRRFEESPYVRGLWPEALRNRTLAAFEQQRLINRSMPFLHPPPGLADVHQALVGTSLRTPVLWLFNSSQRSQAIASRAAARGVDDAQLNTLLGVGALMDRRYLAAERHFQDAQRRAQDVEQPAALRVFALALAGERGRADELMRQASDWLRPKDATPWTWLARTFALADPLAPNAARAPD